MNRHLIYTVAMAALLSYAVPTFAAEQPALGGAGAKAAAEVVVKAVLPAGLEDLINLDEGQLTPDKILEHRQKIRDAVKELTPEQRKLFREKMKAKRDKLTPEQKAERREKIRAYLDSLTPEQRDAFKKKMKKRFEDMPPEKREEMRKKAKERYENMTDAEKEAFKGRMQQHRQKKGPDHRRPDDVGAAPEAQN